MDCYGYIKIPKPIFGLKVLVHSTFLYKLNNMFVEIILVIFFPVWLFWKLSFRYPIRHYCWCLYRWKKKYSKLFWNFSSDFPSNNKKVFPVEKCFPIFYFAKNNTIWLKIPTILTLYIVHYILQKSFFHTSIGLTIFFLHWVSFWPLKWKTMFFPKLQFYYFYKWCLVL